MFSTNLLFLFVHKLKDFFYFFILFFNFNHKKKKKNSWLFIMSKWNLSLSVSLMMTLAFISCIIWLKDSVAVFLIFVQNLVIALLVCFSFGGKKRFSCMHVVDGGISPYIISIVADDVPTSYSWIIFYLYFLKQRILLECEILFFLIIL